MLHSFLRYTFLLVLSVTISSGYIALAAPQNHGSAAALTEGQQREFLLHAKIISGKHIGKGITNPWRLTLSDGTLTHDAAFQSIEQSKDVMPLTDGHTELNFRDSYHFNIAGYELAKLLGLDNMVPVTVERSWQGQTGSLSWWVPWWKMELDRIKENLQPPDVEAWNRQMYRMRVFDLLIFDTDPNLGNILITKDWKIWRIDFTRAFRLSRKLQNPKDLARCDRRLLDKLRQLSFDDVRADTKRHLSKSQVKALMARRDKIVAHFDGLIAQKGDAAVLY